MPDRPTIGATVPMPPVGVIPKWLWAEKTSHWPSDERDDYRAGELIAVMLRYRAAGFEPLAAWDAEYREILARKLTPSGG